MNPRHILLVVGLLGVMGIGTIWLGNANAQTTGTILPLSSPQDIPDAMQADHIPVLKAGVSWKMALNEMEKREGKDGVVGYNKNGHLFTLVTESFNALDDELLVFEWIKSKEKWALIDCSFGGAHTVDSDEISGTDMTLDQILAAECNVYDEEAYYTYGEDVLDWQAFQSQTIQESLKSMSSFIETNYAGKFETITPIAVTTAMVQGAVDEPELNPTFISTSDYDDQVVVGSGQGAKPNEVVIVGDIKEFKGSDPYYVLIMDPVTNKQRYLIESYRLKDVVVNGDVYAKTGILVFVWDDDRKKWILPWTTVSGTSTFTLSGSGSIQALPTINAVQPFLVKSGTAAVVTLEEKSMGSVTLNLSITWDATKQTFDMYEKIDFSKIKDVSKRKVFRFRFDEETEGKILATEAFKNQVLNDIYESALVEVELENVKTKEKVKVIYVTDGAKGALHPLASGVTSGYLRSDIGTEVKKGTYTMTVHLPGYTPIIKTIRIGFDELSNWEVFPGDGGVTETDIRVLQVSPADFLEDICGECADLRACMVCMDDKLISRYNK